MCCSLWCGPESRARTGSPITDFHRLPPKLPKPARLPGTPAAGRQRLVVAMDDVDQAAGSLEPGSFEVAPVVRASHAAFGGGARVVGDDIAGLGETADHDEMAGGALGRGASQCAARVGDDGPEPQRGEAE